MKKLVVLTLGLVFFLGALLYLTVWLYTPNNNSDPDTFSTESSEEAINTDTDGDGLPDWEEDLYGTSKHRADTDGDGVSDAEEVAQGSDPTTYYGQDVSGAQVIQEETDSYQFSQYSSSRSIEDITKEISDYQAHKQEEQESSLQSDTVDPAKRALAYCINNFGSIVQNSLITTIDDSAIINQYLLGENTNTAPIEALVLSHQEASDALDRMNTAQCRDAETFRAELAQLYAEKSQTLEEILDTPQATQEQYQLWYSYATTMQEWIGVIGDIRKLATDEQISFDSSEPGYIFTQSAVQ